ncbi:MAG: hypothetical protein H7A37_06745 [Chlamydiales bacterium]|nr:hypothetical protein [Chlamydiia bacterium]MCP5507980.1 hypothetical protein [Chlamydiales bacterium]
MTQKKSPKNEGSFKDKFHETLDTLKKNEKIEDLYSYASSNTADTIAFVAMVLGILIVWFNPFYGGLIIGVVTGLYFTEELAKPFYSLEGFIEEQGMIRSLVLGGLLLSFFFFLPGVFIGAFIAVVIKQLLMPDKRKKEEDDEE